MENENIYTPIPESAPTEVMTPPETPVTPPAKEKKKLNIDFKPILFLAGASIISSILTGVLSTALTYVPLSLEQFLDYDVISLITGITSVLSSLVSTIIPTLIILVAGFICYKKSVYGALKFFAAENLGSLLCGLITSPVYALMRFLMYSSEISPHIYSVILTVVSTIAVVISIVLSVLFLLGINMFEDKKLGTKKSKAKKAENI